MGTDNAYLTPLGEVSDRIVLTVRMDRSGHREWLDDSGTTALVFWEYNSWWWRPNPYTSRERATDEQDALDRVLNQPLQELRNKRLAYYGEHPGADITTYIENEET